MHSFQFPMSICRYLPKEQDFNIRVGVEYLASVLKQTQGNILEAIGKYNGWHRGLTLVDIFKF